MKYLGNTTEHRDLVNTNTSPVVVRVDFDAVSPNTWKKALTISLENTAPSLVYLTTHIAWNADYTSSNNLNLPYKVVCRRAWDNPNDANYYNLLGTTDYSMVRLVVVSQGVVEFQVKNQSYYDSFTITFTTTASKGNHTYTYHHGGATASTGTIITPTLGYNPSWYFDGIEIKTPLGISSGGTNASTTSQALDNLLPSQWGQQGKVLGTNGTTHSWVSVSGSLPGGSENETIRHDGTGWLPSSALKNTGSRLETSAPTYANFVTPSSTNHVFPTEVVYSTPNSNSLSSTTAPIVYSGWLYRFVNTYPTPTKVIVHRVIDPLCPQYNSEYSANMYPYVYSLGPRSVLFDGSVYTVSTYGSKPLVRWDVSSNPLYPSYSNIDYNLTGPIAANKYCLAYTVRPSGNGYDTVVVRVFNGPVLTYDLTSDDGNTSEIFVEADRFLLLMNRGSSASGRLICLRINEFTGELIHVYTENLESYEVDPIGVSSGSNIFVITRSDSIDNYLIAFPYNSSGYWSRSSAVALPFRIDRFVVCGRVLYGSGPNGDVAYGLTFTSGWHTINLRQLAVRTPSQFTQRTYPWVVYGSVIYGMKSNPHIIPGIFTSSIHSDRLSTQEIYNSTNLISRNVLADYISSSSIHNVACTTKYLNVTETLEAQNVTVTGTLNATLPIGNLLVETVRKICFHYTDFIGPSGAATIESSIPWDYVAISSGTTSKVAGTSSNPGIIRIGSSSTANSGGYVLTDTTAFLLSAGWKCELIFRYLVSGNTNTTIRMGFIDTTSSSDATDGVYVEMAAGSTNLVAKTSSNSNRSSTTLATGLSSNTWYRVVIGVNGSGEAEFELIGMGPKVTIASNVPTSSGRQTGCGFIATNSGTTSTSLLEVDYIAFWRDQNYPTYR